jgi:hypothetical protein
MRNEVAAAPPRQTGTTRTGQQTRVLTLLLALLIALLATGCSSEGEPTDSVADSGPAADNDEIAETPEIPDEPPAEVDVCGLVSVKSIEEFNGPSQRSTNDVPPGTCAYINQISTTQVYIDWEWTKTPIKYTFDYDEDPVPVQGLGDEALEHAKPSLGAFVLVTRSGGHVVKITIGDSSADPEKVHDLMKEALANLP